MPKLFHIDVETTGVDDKIHALVQLSGIIEIDGQEVERVNLNVRPFKGDKVSKEALQVTGNTIEGLRSYPDAKDQYKAFIQVMEKYVDRFNRSDKFYFIGYNSRFDEGFVRRFFEKCGDTYFGSWFHWPAIDVSNLAAIHFMKNGGKPGSMKLMSVAQSLGIDVEEDSAHDAMYDIIITKKVFEHLIQKTENDTMKTLITTLLLTLFTLAAHGQSLIKNTVDEFTGNRIVQSEYVKIDQDGFDGNAYITAIYNAGDYAVVVLIQSRDSWQLLGTDYADFIIDGSRDRKSLHAVESDVVDGGVQESHAFLLSDAEYNEIAEAVNVRFRAARTIYTFNQKAIEALRIVRDEIELN